MQTPNEYVIDKLKQFSGVIPYDDFSDLAVFVAHNFDMKLDEATQLIHSLRGNLEVGSQEYHQQGFGKNNLWRGQDEAHNFGHRPSGDLAEPKSSLPLSGIELVSASHGDVWMIVVECEEKDVSTIEKEYGLSRRPYIEGDLPKKIYLMTPLLKAPKERVEAVAEDIEKDLLQEHSISARVAVDRFCGECHRRTEPSGKIRPEYQKVLMERGLPSCSCWNSLNDSKSWYGPQDVENQGPLEKKGGAADLTEWIVDCGYVFNNTPFAREVDEDLRREVGQPSSAGIDLDFRDLQWRYSSRASASDAMDKIKAIYAIHQLPWRPFVSNTRNYIHMTRECLKCGSQLNPETGKLFPKVQKEYEGRGEPVCYCWDKNLLPPQDRQEDAPLEKKGYKVGDIVRVDKNNEAPWGAAYVGVIERINNDNTLDIRDSKTNQLNVRQRADLVKNPLGEGRPDTRTQQRRVGDPKGFGDSMLDAGDPNVSRNYPGMYMLPRGQEGKEIKDPRSLFYKEASVFKFKIGQGVHVLRPAEVNGIKDAMETEQPALDRGLEQDRGTVTSTYKDLDGVNMYTVRIILAVPSTMVFPWRDGPSTVNKVFDVEIAEDNLEAVKFPQPLHKEAHCGPCTPLKMEAIRMLSDMHFQLNNFDKKYLGALSAQSEEADNAHFIKTLQEVLSTIPSNEKTESKLRKLEQIAVSLQEVQQHINEGEFKADKPDKLHSYLLSNIVKEYGEGIRNEVEMYLKGSVKNPSRKLSEIIAKYSLTTSRHEDSAF